MKRGGTAGGVGRGEERLIDRICIDVVELLLWGFI